MTSKSANVDMIPNENGRSIIEDDYRPRLTLLGFDSLNCLEKNSQLKKKYNEWYNIFFSTHETIDVCVFNTQRVTKCDTD